MIHLQLTLLEIHLQPKLLEIHLQPKLLEIHLQANITDDPPTANITGDPPTAKVTGDPPTANITGKVSFILHHNYTISLQSWKLLQDLLQLHQLVRFYIIAIIHYISNLFIEPDTITGFINTSSASVHRWQVLSLLCVVSLFYL